MAGRVYPKNIVISWNGSYETPRCISFCLPLLLKAKTVSVLQIEEGMVSGPTASDATIHLRRNGIDAAAVNVEAGRRTAGQAVLEEAEKLNADLLIKGAYTRSRIRQMIFGGITSHILNAAAIPVLMCH